MQEEKPRSTSATLLGRLRDENDAEAWTTFCERYGPRIQSWGYKQNLAPEDVEDLTQNVLIRVVKRIRGDWVYDARQNFSGLLRTMWQRAFSDWQDSRTRRVDIGAGGDANVDLVGTLHAVDFVDWLQDFLRREELEEALARLEIDRPEDADFVRARLRGESAAEIAGRVKRDKAAVGMQILRAIASLHKILAELGSDLLDDEKKHE